MFTTTTVAWAVAAQGGPNSHNSSRRAALSEEFEDSTGVIEPPTETIVRPKRKPAKERDHKRQPRYHVVLWDDNDHTVTYVIRMMQELFGHPKEQGFMIAREVDTSGRAICLTTTREHAELKRDQIHAYGKDDDVKNCKGSMSCTIEPEK